jgi:Ca2+/Na+ antiporter
VKKRNKRIFWVVVVLVLVSVSTLLVLGYKKSHNNKDKDENNVVKDNVKIITEESDKQPILVEDDKITFDSNPRYKKGDVIVSGITSSAPNGFIRNVTGVQKTKGKYIIQTEPAVLTDVFEKAHIYKRIELAESQNESESYHIKNMNAVTNELQSSNILCKTEDEDNGTDYMFGKSFEEKEDPVSLSGEAGTSAWVEVSIDIVHGDIKCGIAIRTKEGAKASLECSASYSKELEKQLLTKKLPDYQFIVAGIPIVVTNELEIYTEAEINLEGNIGVSYELTAETTQGFNYNSKTGKVEEINQITCESDGLQWNTISISGDTSMGSSVHLITKLYDASGMDMSLKIAGKAEGEAKVTTNKELDGYAGSLDLSIVPEIKGEIVVDTPVFDKNLLKQPLFEAALKPLWEKHWESSVNWQDDLQWKENDKNEESQETTKVSYSNEYFEVIVPESWEGEWTVTEEDNTMNGIKSTLYRFSHDPADGEEGGAADVYVLDMSDTTRPLSHYSRMLPSAGCEEVGLTSFGYNDVFKMEVANGFFYENGATITLK